MTTSALSSSPTQVTLTITSSAHSSRAAGGVTTAEIGGIVGGILGGFLILSGAIVFVFRRRTPPHEPVPPTEETREQEDSPNFDDVTETRYIVRAPPQPTNLRYPDEYYEVGARVKQ